MLKGRPAGGTRIRTTRNLEATSGITVSAGTEGVLLDTVVSKGDTSPDDLFVARLADGVVLQLRRDDVEQAPPSG
jgi:hypothetical protein